MKRTFVFYEDPGHAWMKVSRAELKKLGLEEKISSYSYQRGDSVYLEEDCDASLFLKALRDTGAEIKIKEQFTNRCSKIRGYDHFRPQP